MARPPTHPLLWLGTLDPGQPLGRQAVSAEEWRWSQELAPARRRLYCGSRARLRAWLAALWQCPPLAVPLHSPRSAAAAAGRPGLHQPQPQR
ncbi:MAG: hypothetical protein KFB97_02460 [Cyanobium sp. M30B3]|nr:MAG: hypothetical protein KFB97_02460 [Cyanobium sp. M30B3]